MLTAGRKQGYQFESLGADRFVAVIGVFLADHRELFSNVDRRGQLVACLDVFVEAGWPAARRLLYRLPELSGKNPLRNKARFKERLEQVFEAFKGRADPSGPPAFIGAEFRDPLEHTTRRYLIDEMLAGLG